MFTGGDLRSSFPNKSSHWSTKPSRRYPTSSACNNVGFKSDICQEPLKTQREAASPPLKKTKRTRAPKIQGTFDGASPPTYLPRNKYFPLYFALRVQEKAHLPEAGRLKTRDISLSLSQGKRRHKEIACI